MFSSFVSFYAVCTCISGILLVCYGLRMMWVNWKVCRSVLDSGTYPQSECAALNPRLQYLQFSKKKNRCNRSQHTLSSTRVSSLSPLRSVFVWTLLRQWQAYPHFLVVNNNKYLISCLLVCPVGVCKRDCHNGIYLTMIGRVTGHGPVENQLRSLAGESAHL